jgi:hypothetical protein
MSREQYDFCAQVIGAAPILPDSVDSPTALFFAVNQLMRGAPFETPPPARGGERGFARSLLDYVRIHLRLLARAPRARSKLNQPRTQLQ